jgi:hypothetical protein
MGRYDEWNGLQKLQGTVVLNHLLFGEQTYICDELTIVNDHERIGIVVKGKELFVYKQKVVEFCIKGNTYTVGDDMLKINVIVNKL